MNNMKTIGKYEIQDKELKNEDLKVGMLYADINSESACILKLISITEYTLSFKYIAGDKDVYLGRKSSGLIEFTNKNYLPWFEVNKITKK